MVVIPWPYADVANLHFPHLNGIGFPTSSISNCILFNKSKFSRKSLKFSKPTFWAILIEPIFPDLINISSAVRLDGISKSYSEIDLPAHFIFFGKFSELISSEKTEEKENTLAVDSKTSEPKIDYRYLTAAVVLGIFLIYWMFLR